MIDPANVPEVTAEELLARFIMQRSHFRPGDGTVKPDAFMPPANLLCSVTRHLQATQDELWSVGEQVAAARGATLHGRADVPVVICTRQQLTVRKAPISDNPNHANICDWPADKAQQKSIAQLLAADATLIRHS